MSGILLATQTIKLVGGNGSSAWIGFASSVLVAIVALLGSWMGANNTKKQLRADREEKRKEENIKETENLINLFTQLFTAKSKNNSRPEPKDTSGGFLEKDDTDFSEEYNLVGHRLMYKLLTDDLDSGWKLQIKVLSILLLLENDFRVSTRTFKEYENLTIFYLKHLRQG